MIERRPFLLEDLDPASATAHGEMFGFSEEKVREILATSAVNSLEVTTWLIDGEAVAVSGLMAPSFLAEEVCVWMVSLAGLPRHRVGFVRQSKRIVADLLRTYSKVYCLCDPNFGDTLRWLSRLGFAKVDTATIQGKAFDTYVRTN